MRTGFLRTCAKALALGCLFWALSGVSWAQTTCIVYCPNGSRPRVACNSTADHCGSSAGSSSDTSGAATLGGAIGTALGQAVGCALFGGPGCPDRNAGRRALASEQNLLGNQAYEKGDFVTAAAYYEKAIRNNPSSEQIHKNLALARARIAEHQAYLLRQAQLEAAERQRKIKATADNMRRTMHGFTQSLNTATPTVGLEFAGVDNAQAPGGLQFDSGTAKPSTPAATGFGISGLPGIYVGGPQDGKCTGSLCGNAQTNPAGSATGGGGIPGLPGIYLSKSSTVMPPLIQSPATNTPAEKSKPDPGGLDFQAEAPRKIELTPGVETDAAPNEPASVPATPTESANLAPVHEVQAAQPLSAAGAVIGAPTANTNPVNPPSLQVLRELATSAPDAKTLEDASVNARRGFDTSLSLPPAPVVLPSPVTVPAGSRSSPKPDLALGGRPSVSPPVAANTLSAIVPSVKGAQPPVPVPSLIESDSFYSLQNRPLSAMNDGGRPIDADGAPVGLHGLVGGTTWTFGFRWPYLQCAERCQSDIKRNLHSQLTLYCSSQGNPEKCLADGLPFSPEMYDLVISMGSAHTFIQDFATRVIFDHKSFGEYSLQNKEIFASLLDRQFDVLDCHSNGALLCLAVLRSGKTTAKSVRLFGPQMSPEAAQRWQEYSLSARTPIHVYLNVGDPVPALSWKLPAPPQTARDKTATLVEAVRVFSRPVDAAAEALFEVYRDTQTDSMAANLKAYGFEVTRNRDLQPARCNLLPGIACHSMKIYESHLPKSAAPPRSR